MSVTTTNFQYPTLKWREKGDPSNLLMTNTEPDNISSTVDDGLTSLSWLQNLNMCMTRLGAPTPPTPPASPVCFGLNYQPSSNRKMNSTPILPVCISSKCKGAVPSSDNVERANSCNQASATSSRNGYSARVQNESQAQSTVSHKSEASKKRASSSQSKPTSSKQSKKGTPQYSPSPPQPSQDVVDYKSNGIIKPSYSYATLICMAMKANKNKMTLSSIYKWIKENFLYYRNADPSWQNSIRHNLSLNKCFIKIARNKDEPGKGGFWKLDPVYSDSLVDGIFKKRRPSHKPSETGNGTVNNAEAKSTKKKSRKKNPTMESNNYIDVIKMHQETPPNSAESYSYKEKMTDASEIVTAVNSINSCTYAYTLHSANIVDCEQGGNLVHGYATEVCIANPANNECIIESDGNDICWNAILTEADLNELVDPITYTDSVGQIIHPIENEIVNTSTPHAKTTTAQLTAVEPHDLDMVATSSNLLEEQQLFYHANQLHSISFEANAGNVITATSNVVTCINDAHITSHWNGWHPYHPNGTMRIECPSRNAELILSQIEQGHDQIMAEVNVVNSNSPIYITNGTPLMSANPLTQMAPKHIPTPVPTPTSTPSMVAESQTMETNSQSPTNYEPASSLQPWAECKAALEAAALDLESFGNLEPIQQF